MQPPQITVIIPTLREAENLPLLIPRIAAALAGRRYEILIVDDNSPDATVEVCRDLTGRYPLRLIVRKPRHGLSGAVVDGMAQAAGDIFVVMDADLQHPPETIPQLLDVLETGGGDFALGSRYIRGGGVEARWGLFRRINSHLATLLARPFAGRVFDPLSGFFALRRKTYLNARRLTPLGYKIGLELMCKAQVRHVHEIPIHFGLRQKGESKLTLKEQFRYLEHLSRLYDFTFPRASPILKFLIVLICGWGAGFGLFALLTDLGVGRDLAPPLAYVGNLAVTAVFHLRYVRTQREFIIRRRPWVDFGIIAFAELVASALAARWIAFRIPIHRSPEIFLIPFGCATLVRYILRKELLQDIRGLRRDPRGIEHQDSPPTEAHR